MLHVSVYTTLQNNHHRTIVECYCCILMSNAHIFSLARWLAHSSSKTLEPQQVLFNRYVFLSLLFHHRICGFGNECLFSLFWAPNSKHRQNSRNYERKNQINQVPIELISAISSFILSLHANLCYNLIRSVQTFWSCFDSTLKNIKTFPRT